MLVIPYPTSAYLIKRKSFLFGFFIYAIRSRAHWATCVISPKNMMNWINKMKKKLNGKLHCTPYLYSQSTPTAPREACVCWFCRALAICLFLTFLNSFTIMGNWFMHFSNFLLQAIEVRWIAEIWIFWKTWVPHYSCYKWHFPSNQAWQNLKIRSDLRPSRTKTKFSVRLITTRWTASETNVLDPEP